MFFESLAELENIIKNSNTAILVLKDGFDFNGNKFDLKKFFAKFKGVEILEPEGSKTSKSKDFYSVDQMHAVAEQTVTQQLEDRYFIFDHAEALREQSENVILKMIEEPKNNVHYIFITTEPYDLLPTIRSRAEIYIPHINHPLDNAPNADAKTMDMAKRLLVAKLPDLFTIADELMKKKEEIRREYACEVIATTIELAYKSYFKTGNTAFAKRIPMLITAYENIKGTGTNIRLQLISAFVTIKA